MKKTMKSLVAVFVMALAFVMTGTTAKAEEVTRFEENMVLDLNVKYLKKSLQNCYL